FKPNNIKSPQNFAKEVNAKLENLLEVYENLMKEYNIAEQLLNMRVKQNLRFYLNCALLFFILHAILFYFLIYQWYGWDTIEPVTYIVGNVYWIIGLGYFV